MADHRPQALPPRRRIRRHQTSGSTRHGAERVGVTTSPRTTAHNTLQDAMLHERAPGRNVALGTWRHSTCNGVHDESSLGPRRRAARYHSARGPTAAPAGENLGVLLVRRRAGGGGPPAPAPAARAPALS